MLDSWIHRGITAAFGLFLIVIAGVVLVAAERPIRAGAVVVIVVLAVLGADAVISAVRKRQALVSRIGPLP